MSCTSYTFIYNTILEASKTLEVLPRELAAGATRITGCSCAQVWLHDGSQLVRAFPPSCVMAEPSSVSGVRFAGRPFVEGRPVCVNDFRKSGDGPWPCESHGNKRYRSGLSVPLSMGDRVIGSLVMLDHRIEAFGNRETGMMAMAGALFGLGVHHSTYFPEFLPYWAASVAMRSSSHAGAVRTTPGWGDHSHHLPKGINEPTLRTLSERLVAATTARSVAEIALDLGLSGVTVRRYLEYLAGLSLVSRGSRYPETGRPSHTYWLTHGQADAMASFLGTSPVTPMKESVRRESPILRGRAYDAKSPA